MPIKAATKTIWLLVLAAFVIGLGLTGIGVAMGGKIPTGFGPDGMRYFSYQTNTHYDRNMNPRFSAEFTTISDVVEDVHSISVLGVTTNIAIVSDGSSTASDGSAISYSIYAQNPDDYRVRVRGGELSIEYRTHNGFNFGFGFFNSRTPEPSHIEIRVPSDVELRDVSLQVVSGSIDVQAANALQVDRLEADIVSGDINIAQLGTELQLTRLVIQCVSGDVNINGLGTELQPVDLTVNNLSGDINIFDARLAGFDLSQVSGSTTVTIFDLDGFDVEVSNISGSVTKDGQSLIRGIGEISVGDGTGGRINIDTVSGNVSLVSTNP